ncbi:MAG: hypothetical protein P8178_12430, partial [Candidatus Thiodiazotropha sp.]
LTCHTDFEHINPMDSLHGISLETKGFRFSTRGKLNGEAGMGLFLSRNHHTPAVRRMPTIFHHRFMSKI